MEMSPNKSEELFLSLGYNRFYDLFDEIIKDSFWEKEDWYRFSKVSNIFAVYSELLTYEPFKHVLEAIKIQRPPMESEIGGPLFKFVRNILAHFPVFETWDNVWVSKELVNWQREGLTIDRFLKKYSGHAEVKYRFWEAEKKTMNYMSIRFPQEYGDNKVYLKDMLAEKDGVKFALIMMRKILNTQVESVGEKA
ncbi:hypothetical protein [Moritella sp. 28]|uniref:hypothetical protein n=1 Tax=Moritella sp. 28 TaxID=2746232 RepID=UPI001BA456D8|nr:hypothetical protein [Moritella sp. 28]QUM85463.1 hypothetical protein HWV02_13585 [Moritella sp. 28]